MAALAFTALAALKLSATIWCWPIAVAGIALAGWTVYSNPLRNDPLMETFYKIVGKKERLEELSQIDLVQANPDERLSSAIQRLDWNTLTSSIYRAKTLDDRHVIIIRGISRADDNWQTKEVLAFVEKLGPKDRQRGLSNLPSRVEALMHALNFFEETPLAVVSILAPALILVLVNTIVVLKCTPLFPAIEQMNFLPSWQMFDSLLTRVLSLSNGLPMHSKLKLPAFLKWQSQEIAMISPRLREESLEKGIRAKRGKDYSKLCLALL